MARNKSIADQLNGYTAQDAKDKSKDLAQTTTSAVQDISSKAVDVAQSTASNVQQNVQSSLDAIEGLLRRSNIQASKKVKKNVRNVQQNTQSGWNNTQDLLQLALGVAAVLLETNKQLASKNLKSAKKNLGQLQGAVQDNVQSGLGFAQDVLGRSQDILNKSTKSAGKNLQKVGSNVKDLQDSLNDRIASYQRKRARNKFLFRFGLVAGIVGALLLTPQPGAKTRQQLGSYWQALAQRSQQVLDRFLS